MARRYQALVLRKDVEVPQIDLLRAAVDLWRGRPDVGLRPFRTVNNSSNQVVSQVHQPGKPPLEVALIEIDREGLGVTVRSLKDPTVAIDVPLAAIAYGVHYPEPVKTQVKK